MQDEVWGDRNFIQISDTMERLAPGGLRRQPAKFLMDMVPIILEETTVNLGDLDTDLHGDTGFVLGISLASTNDYLFLLKPHEREPNPDFVRAKIAVTNNPQIDDKERRRRLAKKRRQRAKVELRRMQESVAEV